MSIYSGPEIDNTGLVLYYDMGNTQQSWIGAPTTNLLTGSDGLTTGWSGYCGNLSNVTYNTTDVLAPNGQFNATRVIMDGSTGCGAGACWGLLWGTGGIFVSGQTYTVSLWARCGFGTTTMTLGMNDAFGTGVTLTTAWQRFTFTATITGNLSRGLQFIRGDSTAGITIYVWGAQTELGSFATAYVSSGLTQGVRSNTQALLDMTGNDTVTVTSLTYASNNTFSFNGSSNYIDVTPLAGINARTVIAWVKLSTTAGGDYVVYGLDANGSDNWFGINGNRVFFFGTQSSDVNNFSFSGTTTLNATSYYQIAMTINVSTATIYLNGVQEAASTQAFVIGPWNTAPTIGRRGSLAQRYFPGNIDIVMAYDVVLTAEQINQNFQALRSRFGI